MVVPTYCALGLLTQMALSELISVCLPDTTAQLLVFAGGIVMILVFIVLFARAKIAYEEEPDADFQDVMTKTMTMGPLPFKSWAKFSSGDLERLPITAASLTTMRSMSHWDCAAFQDSF